MATREKGEVSIVVDGTTYVLRPTINAICDLEERTGKTFAQLSVLAETGNLTAARDLIWCFLQDRHAEEIKTPQDAGFWLQRVGGLEEIGETLQAVASANKAPETTGRPRTAQARTGERSTLPRAASV
jgi:hypothetical protein